MPRPTAAQLAYGSCTVILCSLAMLVLSGPTAAPPVAVVVVIAVVALALGVAVAITAAPAQGRRTPASARTERGHEPVSAGAATRSATPVREHAGH